MGGSGLTWISRITDTDNSTCPQGPWRPPASSTMSMNCKRTRRGRPASADHGLGLRNIAGQMQVSPPAGVTSGQCTTAHVGALQREVPLREDAVGLCGMKGGGADG